MRRWGLTAFSAAPRGVVWPQNMLHSNPQRFTLSAASCFKTFSLPPLFSTNERSSSFTRWFSSSAAAAAPALPQIPESARPPSLRQESLSTRKNLRVSPWKLNEICRLIRGLNVDEAMIQLKLSQKKKAVWIQNAIRSAKVAGVHNFQMDPKRMIVSLAYVTRGTPLKRINYHSKGRSGRKQINMAHLTVAVREVAETPVDRLGRFGRKPSTIQRTIERVKAKKDAANVEKIKNAVAKPVKGSPL